TVGARSGSTWATAIVAVPTATAATERTCMNLIVCSQHQCCTRAYFQRRNHNCDSNCTTLHAMASRGTNTGDSLRESPAVLCHELPCNCRGLPLPLLFMSSAPRRSHQDDDWTMDE